MIKISLSVIHPLHMRSAATAAQKNQGPRSDITCQQQPLRLVVISHANNNRCTSTFTQEA
jgi:hypothetical protein